MKNTKYSPDEIIMLKDNYNILSKKELATLMGRSYNSVISKAFELGISKKNLNDGNKQYRFCTVCKKKYPKTKKYFTTFISKKYGETWQSKCKSCDKIYVQNINSQPTKYLKDLVRGIQSDKKRTNKGFDIDYDYIISLYNKQNKKCALTGIEMTTFKGKGLYFSNVSIDRINSKLGYLKNNVQLVCFWANHAKGTLSIIEFKNMINITNNYLK